MTFEELLSRFPGPRKPNGDGYLVTCSMGHDRRTPSLSIRPPANGTGPRIYCFGCGTDRKEILEAAGLKLEDVWQPPARKTARGKGRRTDAPLKETRYEVRDPSGNLVAVHVRQDFAVEPLKDMPWQLPDGSWGLKGVKKSSLPLYGVEHLADAPGHDPVIVCEGEKAADALRSNGILAVGTVTGASGTPGDEALRPLLDRFKVYLWRDNDPPGEKHMERIGKALVRLGHEGVYVVDWTGGPPKGDAADLVSLEAWRDEYDALLQAAQPFEWIQEGKRLAEEAEALAVAAQPGPGLERFRATDLWNARLFAHLHGDKVRYCERLGGWHYFDGKRWLRSENGEVERLAKETIRELYSMAGREEKDSRRAALAKHAAKSEAAGKLTAMLTLASTEEGIAVPPEVFDRDPWKFNVQNGTLVFDPETVTVRLEPHRPEDLITNISPAEYRGLIPPGPIFAKYLLDSADGDVNLIGFRQRLAGYALTGDMREQVFEYAYGPEAGGKGTETRARADVMGTYARSSEMSTFLTFRSEKVRNDLAGLIGARLVTATETQEGQVLDEELIRVLTGQDKLRVRFLFRENFETECTFKVRFEGNARPHIRSVGGATWRRLLIVPFMKTVPEKKRDKTLGEKLKSPDERAGILAWMVAGALDWLRGGLRPPDKVRAAVADYRKAEDRLAPFLEECTAEHPSGQVPAGELYSTYKMWSETSGERPMSKRALGLRLEEKGYRPGRTTKSARAWEGLVLVNRGDES